MKTRTLIITLLLSSSGVFATDDAACLYKQGTAAYKSDPASAVESFEQAAAEGHVGAMVGLATCYENGRGTDIDFAKALEWYEKAARQKSLDGIEGLARIYATCPDPRFHDGAKAVKFAAVIARAKPRDADALGLLAAAHARDMDFLSAARAGSKAVGLARDKGSVVALNKRSENYKQGIPFPKVVSGDWLLRAADARNSWAVERLAYRAGDRHDSMYSTTLALDMCQKGVKAGVFALYALQGAVYLDIGDLNAAYDSYEAAYEHMERNQLPDGVIMAKHYIKAPANEVYQRARKALEEGEEEGYLLGPITGSGQRSWYRSGWTEGKFRCKDCQLEYYKSFGSYKREIGNNELHCESCYLVTKGTRTKRAKADEAYLLYKIAALQGNPDAKRELAAMDAEIMAYKDLLKNKSSLPENERAEVFRLEADKHKKNQVIPQNFDVAARLYEKSFELNPMIQIAYDAGIVYYFLEDPQAVEWLERAHDMKSRDASIMLIDLLATKRGQNFWNGPKAIEIAQELVARSNPDDTHTLRLLACAYARDGQFNKAVTTMDQAVAIAEQNSKGAVSYLERLRDQFEREEAWSNVILMEKELLKEEYL